MNKEEIVKQIAQYRQEAEIALANYHRLTGAVLALEAVIKVPDEPEPIKE